MPRRPQPLYYATEADDPRAQTDARLLEQCTLGKRPIDLKRDAGKSIRVGDDNEPITEFVTLKDRLFAVKARSIYEVILADKIDPQRENINIPDATQKVLGHGSETEFVGRTLLTASELLKGRYLSLSEEQCKQCIAHAYDAVRDVAAMHELSVAIAKEIQSAMKEGSLSASRGAVALPSVGNLVPRVKDFIQKADHTLLALMSIVKVFYPGQKNLFEGLAERITNTFGKGDPLAEFLNSNVPFLVTIRHARNAVEHPKDDQKIVCTDFSIQPDGSAAPPLIELVDKKVPLQKMLLTTFMQETTEQIVAVFESIVAGLCDKHEREAGGVRFAVFQFPAGEQGLSRHVRYAHGVFMGNQLVRAQ